MPPESAATVAAYQRLQLLEIRNLYDKLDLDLDRYLTFERGAAREIASIEDEFGEIRETLASLGADLSEPGGDSIGVPVPALESRVRRYKTVHVKRADDFQELVGQAEDYLAKANLDLSRDPLLQVLGDGEIANLTESYRVRYGNVVWDESDYLVVVLAGFIATLLDAFLVRIPADASFLGKLQTGSPITKWMKENSKPVHEHLLSRLEGAAKVPYDDSIGKTVDGLSPKVHRLMSPGHDPILGFIFGVIDITSGTGTFIDKHGDMKKVGKSLGSEDLTVAFLKVFVHLLSDVCTSAGIPPPFFTLLQLVKAKSPFVLGPSGEKVSWTNVARYMYTHGYDLRHFATMSIVPATVEMLIRGWWLCRSFEDRDQAELARAKMTSMLLAGHAIAASGNLLKTGAIYGMNPLALNWAVMLRLFPVTLSWIRETAKRDQTIRDELDAAWMSMYRANTGYPA